ncbi:MAG: cell division protein FtsX [Pseudomonadota bacterium]
MSRETPLLPISDAREAALFFVIGALCFLAALAALVSRGTYTAAAAWGAQIEGEVSVLLQNADRRSADAAAERLSSLANVFEARVLPREELEALLEPSFGPGGLPDGLPLPMLIAVQTDIDAGDPVMAIEQTLQDAGFEAEVSAHGTYARQMRDTLAVLRYAALSAVALLAATAIAVIAFATHAALLARRDIVDVLHLSGAEDRYIAGLFERRFWVLALKAGAAGALAALMGTALLVFSATRQAASAGTLLPRLSLDFWDLVILILTPIAAGIAARAAARVTVVRALRASL